MADTPTKSHSQQVSHPPCPATALLIDEEVAMMRIRALFVGIQAMIAENDSEEDIDELAGLGEAIAKDRLRALRPHAGQVPDAEF